MAKFATIEGLRRAEGSVLGESSWIEITQEQVDAFADATGDHQWIHVDPERAKTGPYGTTIAHGYLTLSLVPRFLAEIYSVEEKRIGINYGSNKVRFPAPVPVGSRIRGTARLLSLDEIPGGAQVTVEVTVASDTGSKPVLVAEVVTRILV